MKKICLSLILSVVSIFSISAQTKYKITANAGLAENVKSNPAAERVEDDTVKSIDKSSETNSSEKRNYQANLVINLPIISTLMVNKSLGSFSTGNQEIDIYIEQFSGLYNIDPLLIYAQMSQESSFKQKAVSHKGASGLMQLIPDTAKRFGVKNIYNPEQNIKAGVKYMRWLLDEFDGDMSLALAAYNAGEGAVRKYGNKIPPYRETRNYVAKIMAHYEQLSKQTSIQNETLAKNF